MKKILHKHSYPSWETFSLMSSSDFDIFIQKIFEDFQNWESFYVRVDNKKIGPISIEHEFAASSHTIEKFSLKMHSIEVLKRCYEQRYFYALKNILSFQCFSYLLLFHDIGKNIAVEWSGTKHNQHRYTIAMVEYILTKKSCIVWFPLIKSVIGMDPLGRFLKGFDSIYSVFEMIKKAANQSEKSIGHFFRILEFYYFCDASAYPSLKKKIFTFTSGGKLLLSPKHSRYSDYLHLKQLCL